MKRAPGTFPAAAVCLATALCSLLLLAGGNAMAQVLVGGGVSGAGGAWAPAREVPGTPALNHGGSASVYSVSCSSAGSCGAGGFYRDGSGRTQAFVVTEQKGAWGKARQVPGTATLNKGGNAGINSVSCTSAAHCSAGGFYAGRGRHLQAFVVSQS
jgi:hypothetical protein